MEVKQVVLKYRGVVLQVYKLEFHPVNPLNDGGDGCRIMNFHF
jgi:hypothetical protein